MSKQREALQMALEALIEVTGWQWAGPMRVIDEVEDAIAAIREALAEPEPWTPDDMAYRPGGLPMDAEQEPVAWMLMNNTHCHIMATKWKPEDSDGWKTVPLYTAPPARQPLTDYQIREIDKLVWEELSWEEKTFGQFALKMARAIERAHSIGN